MEGRFKINPFFQLRRFLVLGTDGSSYSAKEDALKIMKASGVFDELLSTGFGVNIVQLIGEMSESGGCAKQDALLYHLALCCRSSDAATKKAAFEAIPRVCGTPTHLFQFISFIESSSDTSGWGRALRKAVSQWYCKKTPQQLAYVITKYPSRCGWSHRDLLRLCHAKPTTAGICLVLAYATHGIEAARAKANQKIDSEPGTEECGVAATAATVLPLDRLVWQLCGTDPVAESSLEEGEPEKVEAKQLNEALNFLEAVVALRTATDDDEPHVIQLIKKFNLAREQIPTIFLSSPNVWLALLDRMPPLAMIRNLGKMSSLNIFVPGSPAETIVLSKLQDEAALQRARLHPLQVLIALKQYQSGHGDKGSLEWRASEAILAALNTAFNLSFRLVEPTGKRLILGLDVSGSMEIKIPGTSLTAREASVAMVLLAMKTEPEENVHLLTFQKNIVPFPLPRTSTLESAMQAVRKLPFGVTACARPIEYALEKKIAVDAFIIYTDSEVNNGPPPATALCRYREAMRIPDAKLIVVGMTATDITIADPTDPNMLDVVGFDANTPLIMAEFLGGKI